MRTSTFPLVDRILKGQLAELLLGWQADDVALSEMAHRLRTEHDITVSVETIRRWLIRLNKKGDSPTAKAAS